MIDCALLLQSIEPEDLGATEFINITAGVKALVDSVQTITNVSDCCKYNHQILDKFCALQSPVSVY